MARGQSSVDSSTRALPRDAKFLVAVSGGIDSCVLLHCLQRLRRLLRCELHVAHVDHAFRASSRKDAEFVAQLAASYELPFHAVRLGKLPARANLENWAREQRYAFFEEIRKREQLDWILTAHQANDVAETFLLRMLSNREPRTILALDRQRALLRPLILVSREQIEQYSLRFSLKCVQDESNADPRFMRNRVRHELIPLLISEYALGSIENLTRRALAAATDTQLLDAEAGKFNSVLDAQSLCSRGWIRELLQLLPQIPQGLEWRVIEKSFFSRLGFRLGRDQSQAVLRFIQGNALELRLPAATALIRSKGAILIKSGR